MTGFSAWHKHRYNAQRAVRIGEHTRHACGSLRLGDDGFDLWEVREAGTPSPAPGTGALPNQCVRRGEPLHNEVDLMIQFKRLTAEKPSV